MSASVPAPVLFVVPPSPHLSKLGASSAINERVSHVNGSSNERLVIANADTSSSLDTATSSSSSTTAGRTGMVEAASRQRHN
jgi:hypothetical protein